MMSENKKAEKTKQAAGKILTNAKRHAKSVQNKRGVKTKQFSKMYMATEGLHTFTTKKQKAVKSIRTQWQNITSELAFGSNATYLSFYRKTNKSWTGKSQS